MELLISLIKEILNPFLNLIGSIGERKRIKTDRLINLINQTKELESKGLTKFLSRELERSIFLELKGVDFTEEQIKIIEKEITDSGYRISWYHVRTAKKYIHFKNNRLRTSFSPWDNLLNWGSFAVGVLFTIAFVYIIYKSYSEKAVAGIFEITTILILLIFATGFVGVILNGTNAYFAGQRIKREVK